MCIRDRLYIERWLTASMERDGEIIERMRGTPQGGVISPILSNLFLHYAFDLWMSRTHRDLPWCRYADDGLVHCRTEQEAEALRGELQARLDVCGLQMHPTKTKIVYCKDNRLSLIHICKPRRRIRRRLFKTDPSSGVGAIISRVLTRRI